LNMEQIRVAIVEDQKETREMLTQLVNGHPGYTCTGSFASGEEAIAAMPGLQPHVVLMDIHLPGNTGTQCVKILRQSCPATQFVMCTSLEDADNIFNALQAGATGYLVKSSGPEKITEAIADAYNGGSPMSSQVARKVVGYFGGQEKIKAANELEKLSAREQEILTYLSKGYRYKEVAGKLFISIETVRKHIHNIYEKLQVNSRIEAVNKTRLHN
jgi:DNA-binding NarL/FixJ family response regulator